jgi:hypothetical protein
MCGSTCFERLPAHHQKHTTALAASGITVGEKRLERCWSWSGRPRPTTLQPLHSNGKTRGSRGSCTLLMMGGGALETCWATHKRQVINLWNCCILLVELFESYDDARTCERQICVHSLHFVHEGNVWRLDDVLIERRSGRFVRCFLIIKPTRCTNFSDLF